MAVRRNAADTMWEARVYWKGAQVAMATHRLKANATGWHDAQIDALKAGTWTNPRNSDVTLGDVIDKFVESRRGSISEHAWATEESHFRIHIPTEDKRKPIGVFGKARIEELFADMLRTKARKTVLRFRDSLLALLTYATTHKYLAVNAVSTSKVPPGDGTRRNAVRVWNHHELEELLTKVRERRPHYALFIEFLELTGIRWGELRALRARDIKTSQRPGIEISRSHSDAFSEKVPKSGRSRVVPLMGRAPEIVAQLAAGKEPDDHIFATPSGTRPSGPNMTRSLKWKEIAGGRRMHDLRHTAASRWLEAGVSIKTVSHWLGHSSAKITLDIYSHLIDGVSDETAIARLAAFEKARKELAEQ